MFAQAAPSILITRPRPFAEELAAGIQGEGWNPVILDILATQPAANQQQIQQKLRNLLPVDRVIFTSRSAVNYAFEVLAPAELEGVRIAAVGQGTARELQAFGFTSVVTPAEGANSEALLKLDEFSATNAESVLIFCAPGGRDLLQQELAARGWQVHIAEVYERVTRAPASSVITQIDESTQLISVFTSATAISACHKLLPAPVWQLLLDQPWLVISERLEAIAREMGARDIYRSVGPGNAAILDAIHGIV